MTFQCIMSTYFGWQRVIWFDQLLIQYEIFWRGMHYELIHYELVYCILVTEQPEHKQILRRFHVSSQRLFLPHCIPLGTYLPA